ncbi:MAG TPA: PilZ domain-containing protein [Burkholderiales bacterium]|nr:PilZ domain-containing protein [Burkholderiales bacterium]
MEHRWSARKPVTGNVVVECPRVGLIRATMRDVSLSGMFVETGPMVLPLNAPVSVVFSLSPSKSGDDHCLQAMIVRHTTKGAGIMFLDPDTDIIRAMRSTLYADMPSVLTRRAGGIAPGAAREATVASPQK